MVFQAGWPGIKMNGHAPKVTLTSQRWHSTKAPGNPVTRYFTVLTRGGQDSHLH